MAGTPDPPSPHVSAVAVAPNPRVCLNRQRRPEAPSGVTLCARQPMSHPSRSPGGKCPSRDDVSDIVSSGNPLWMASSGGGLGSTLRGVWGSELVSDWSAMVESEAEKKLEPVPEPVCHHTTHVRPNPK
eukprot:1719960-Rhodomonas_salina.2